MLGVFLLVMLFIGTAFASVESFRTWGIKGDLGALALLIGLTIAIMILNIPYGAGISLMVAVGVFRKAQTSRMLMIANEQTETEQLLNILE